MTDTPDTDPETKPAPKPRRARGSIRNKMRWAKRIIVIGLLILLVLLLLNWKYCQRGKGSGGLEAADGSQTEGMSQMTSSTATTAPKRLRAICRLRVDKKGVSHKGKVLKIPEAVKACRGAKRAELSVTGDATFGIVKQLQQALGAAGVTAVRR